MPILDSKGRLFGKVSLLDLGAGLIIVMVLVAIFFFPGTGGSVAQVGTRTQPVEVDIIVRGLSVSDPEALFETFQTAKTTNIIIRNQPYGEVGIKSVRLLPRSVAVPQPDGTVKAYEDPRPEMDYTLDMLITLTGDAQITENGPVFGNNKVKIGTQMELDGPTYDFFSSVVGVRLLEE